MNPAHLFVWAAEADYGGISIWWVDTPPEAMAFIAFGRFGGGYAPLGCLDEATRAKYEEGCRRYTERFGQEVVLKWGIAPPPAEGA